MKNILYFAIETQRSLKDVGGLYFKSKMGVSLAVTYSTARGSYEVYDYTEMEKLAKELVQADLVVGWNHVHFDYQILQPYILNTIVAETRNLDMMLELVAMIGYRIELESVAAADLGEDKFSSLQAKLLRQANRESEEPSSLQEVLDHCIQKIKMMKDVYEFAIQNGSLRYSNTNNEIVEVPLDWRDRIGPTIQKIKGCESNIMHSLSKRPGLRLDCFDGSALEGIPCQVIKKYGKINGIITHYCGSSVGVKYLTEYVSQTRGTRVSWEELSEKWVTAVLNPYQIAYVVSTATWLPYEEEIPADDGFVYPPDTFSQPEDGDYDYEESTRERESLIEDLASDNSDFSRSNEEGWYYSDKKQ